MTSKALRTAMGGGVYKNQPVTSIFVPKPVVGGMADRTPAQARRMKALGNIYLSLKVNQMRRRNPADDIGQQLKIVIGAAKCLNKVPGEELIRAGFNMTPSQLKEQYDLTDSQVKKLKASVALFDEIQAASRRQPNPELRTPEMVYDYFGPKAAYAENESFWAVPLNARSILIGKPLQLSLGDVDGTDAGPRKFYRECLKAGAVSALAVHNHPSGDPTPGPADLAVTRRLVQAGKAVDVMFVDHIIIGLRGYWSLRRYQPNLWTE